MPQLVDPKALPAYLTALIDHTPRGCGLIEHLWLLSGLDGCNCCFCLLHFGRILVEIQLNRHRMLATRFQGHYTASLSFIAARIGVVRAGFQTGYVAVS